MNIPYNHLSETTQNLIAKEFGEEVGRKDWPFIRKQLLDAEVILYFKVGAKNTAKTAQAMHNLLKTPKS